MRFLDTNVIIRYLTGDDPEKERASGALLGRLDRGEEEVMSSESVIAEVVYVLTSRAHYGVQPREAAERLKPVVLARGLRLPDKRTVLHALDVYASYPFLDFEDALSVAHMATAGLGEIVSYDRGFDRVPGLIRVEPSD